MGRLIDATRLRTEVDLLLEKNLLRPTAMATMHNLIDAQPTAFDVEEVVEQMKEKSFVDIDEQYADDGQRMLFLYDAIEIVKGGMKMIELKECNKDCFCKDCTDTECLHAGKAEADCPRYTCVFQPYTKEYLDCENCSWLKGWYAEMRKGDVK